LSSTRAKPIVVRWLARNNNDRDVPHSIAAALKNALPQSSPPRGEEVFPRSRGPPNKGCTLPTRNAAAVCEFAARPITLSGTMCELLGLSFARPLSADFSIRIFALRGAENADGWGLAWYPDRSLSIVKEPL